jgi:hypothetical protein
MALGDPYLSVADFKVRTRSQSSSNDEMIAAALESASRSIDDYCAREFNHSENDEYRVFSSSAFAWDWFRRPLDVGDVVSITEIASDDGSGAFPDVWAVDSYELWPRTPRSGWPYRQVRASLIASASMPLTAYGIRIAGVFGFPAVPAPIKEATFLTANRLLSLYDAPFGKSGGGDMGSLDMTTSLTPIIKSMVKPYRARTA